MTPLVGCVSNPPAACLSWVRPDMNNALGRHLTERLVKGGAPSNDSKQALSLTFPRKVGGGEGRTGGAMTHRDGGSQMWSFSPKYSLNLFGCWTRWDVTRRLHLCFILWQTQQLLCNSDCLLLNWIVLKHLSLLHWRTPPVNQLYIGEQQLLLKKKQLQHDAITCLNICHMPHHL